MASHSEMIAISDREAAIKAITDGVVRMDDGGLRLALCASFGHPPVVRVCFGYVYCLRCNVQLGDTLAGVYDLAAVAIVGHSCATCDAIVAGLTPDQKLLTSVGTDATPAQAQAERDATPAQAQAERAVTTALVHIEGEGQWLRVTERHTPARRLELRRYACAFDDGYYSAVRIAEARGFYCLPHRTGMSASYADLRDHVLNYTDDEILAARVALELVGPARSNPWS